MAEAKKGGGSERPAPDESAVRRAVSGTAKAVVSTFQSISGSFLALIGKSSGANRAMGREAAVIYDLAPAVIRRVHRGLADDEVDDVVSLLVQKELKAEHPQWIFVRYPELRETIVLDAIREYIRGKDRGWRKRARADGMFLSDHDELLIVGMDPAAMLQKAEAQAILDAVIARMSDERRMIYTAIRLDGWSHKELAAATGWSLPFIKRHMTRANQMVAAAARAFLEGHLPVVPKRGRPRKILGGTPT